VADDHYRRTPPRAHIVSIRQYERACGEDRFIHSMEKLTRVLFVCRDNASRSLIAEAILLAIDGRRFDARSAGVDPSEVAHPLALDVLQTHHVASKGLVPKDVREFYGQCFEYVIALHDRATERPPEFPSAEVMSWSFGDPAAAPDPKRAFEHLFVELNQRIRLLVIIIERFYWQGHAA
jgi:arsenate reductase